MKLSIIIPAYNAENCISNCLDDLLQQNMSDYEIIVVDDGSTDNTASILLSYKNQYPSIIKIIQISNGGQGRARNFALREAKGEYIGFVDADDRCSYTMFPKLLDCAIESNADIVICDFYKVDGNNKYYEKAAIQDDILSPAGAVWNKLFRSKIIGGVRFSEGIWYEDLTFSAKLLLKSKKTIFISEPLYYYTVGHTSTMKNDNSEKNLDIIKAVEDIKTFLNRNNIDYNIDFLVINHILLESIKRVSKQKSPNRRVVLKKLRNYVKANIPNLETSNVYIRENRNRRIIMKLNYRGLYFISNVLLRINEVKHNNSSL